MSVIQIMHQVAMSVHVNKKFKAYKSGIFNDPACPKNSANHALLTVGYILSSSSPKPWPCPFDCRVHLIIKIIMADLITTVFVTKIHRLMIICRWKYKFINVIIIIIIANIIKKGGSTAQSIRRQSGSWRTRGGRLGARSLKIIMRMVMGMAIDGARQISRWWFYCLVSFVYFQGGYIYLEYGKNVCGMAKSPLYAEVWEREAEIKKRLIIAYLFVLWSAGSPW